MLCRAAWCLCTASVADRDICSAVWRLQHEAAQECRTYPALTSPLACIPGDPCMACVLPCLLAQTTNSAASVVFWLQG